MQITEEVKGIEIKSGWQTRTKGYFRSETCFGLSFMRGVHNSCERGGFESIGEGILFLLLFDFHKKVGQNERRVVDFISRVGMEKWKVERN